MADHDRAQCHIVWAQVRLFILLLMFICINGTTTRYYESTMAGKVWQVELKRRVVSLGSGMFLLLTFTCLFMTTTDYYEFTMRVWYGRQSRNDATRRLGIFVRIGTWLPVVCDPSSHDHDAIYFYKQKPRSTALVPHSSTFQNGTVLYVFLQEVRCLGDAISLRIFTPLLASNLRFIIKTNILTPLLGRDTFHTLMCSIRITRGIIKTKTSGSFHERFFVIEGQSHWGAQQNYRWCDALSR